MSSSRIPLMSLSVSLGLGLTFGGLPAHAGKKECAASYVEAQKLKQAGSFIKARDQLLVCAADECLAAVKKDCVAWLDEVNAALPSIVVDAKGPDGRETFDVKVSIDGEVVRDKLDVKAIELDPGTHKLVFEHEGAEPIEQELTVRQGQKNKVVEVSFAKSTPAPPVAPEPEPEPEPAPKAAAGPPTISYVLGGVGLLALGGAGYFWLGAESKKSDLESSKCEPFCSQDDVDAIEQKRLFGDVAAGIGVACLGAAAYLWLTNDTPAAPKEAAALDLRLGPNGAYATVRRRF